MAKALIQYFKGDTFIGQVDLIQKDANEDEAAYEIPDGATVEIQFLPATGSTPVSLSSEDDEVEIDAPDAGSCQFTISEEKGDLLKIGAALPMNLIVTNSDGEETTFEELRAITVAKRATEA